MNGNNNNQQSPKVISFFSGCGGSSLGYKMAGCKVILAIDWEKRAIDTYRLNFPDTKVIKANIRNITKDNIFELSGIEKPRQLDILDGSPPCTPFSTSGDREKSWNKSYIHNGDTNKQRTDDLFFEYIRLISILKPKIFVAENVRGLIIGKSKGYFKNIINEIRKSTNNEYKVNAILVNAKDFEVAQSRERIIIYGIRNDIEIDETIKLNTYPETSFSDVIQPNNIEIPQQELDYAYKIFNNSNNSIYFKQIKQGEKCDKYHPNGSGFNYKRLRYNKPSYTITTNNTLIHPLEDRFLTLTEYKRLSSFPDNFKFLNQNDGIIRVGNSVPPKLMYHIIRYLLKKIKMIK